MCLSCFDEVSKKKMVEDTESLFKKGALGLYVRKA